MAKKTACPKKYRKWIGIGAAAALVLLGTVFLVQTQKTAPQEEGVRLLLTGKASKIRKSAEQKGQFTIACGQLPVDTTFYQGSDRTARQLSRLLYEPLLRVSAKGEVEPVLAKTIVFAEDGRSAEVTLGKHRFSDGSFVTAQDVYNAYVQAVKGADAECVWKDAVAAIEGGEAYLRKNADGVTGIEVLGEERLRFTFCRPSVQNLEAMTVPIVKESPESEFLLGSGSYQIERFRGLQEIVLTANPHGENPFGYRQIRFINGTRQALEQGSAQCTVDAMTVGNQDIYELVQSAGGYHVYAYPTTERAYINFAPNSTLTLRQAVGAAVDTDDFWKNVDALHQTPNGNLPVEGFAAPRYAGQDAVSEQLKKMSAKKLAEELAGERGKAAVTVAVEDTTMNRSYIGILTQQLAEQGMELQANYGASPESCDMTLSFADLRTPEDMLRQALGDADYESWIAQQLHRDCRNVYAAMEERALQTLPVLPMGAAAQQVAVLADCKERALMELLWLP